MAPKDILPSPVVAQLSELCATLRTLKTRLDDHVKHSDELGELARKKLDDFIDEVRRTNEKIGDNLAALSEAVGRVHRRIDRLVLAISGSLIMVLLIVIGWMAKELLSRT